MASELTKFTLDGTELEIVDSSASGTNISKINSMKTLAITAGTIGA